MPPGRYGRQKGVRVSELSDAVRRLLRHFGRPETMAATIEHDEAVDTRLTDLERRQLEIAARLRILEKASNPRGIGFDC